MLNPRLETLSDYPFQRLARLLGPIDPPPGRPPVDLSIGQPMHPIPPLMIAALRANEHLWGRYPPVTGSPEFRRAAAAWLTRRYRLPEGLLDPERHVLPVAGTKEALFLIAQAVTAEHKAGRRPAVLLPNPFYNVYLGGAVMAGAEPVLLTVTAETGYWPALDELGPELLDRTAAFYLCSPANPQGVAADLGYLKRLVALARRHRFLLILDECYAEIYSGDPPVGGLEAAVALDGRLDSVIVCHSLSKRSSAAGLRSGFVAGDLDVLAGFARLAQLRCRGPAVAGAGGRDRAVAGRGACDRQPRPLSRKIRSRRSTGSAAGWATIARMAASFCGWRSATARRPRGGSGPKPLSRSCRGRISVVRTARATTRARARSGSRWCMISRPPRRRSPTWSRS